MTYGKKVLVAIDQLFNALVGGWPDETLSSRCGRWSKDGVRDWPRRIIDGLPFWKAGHCLRAYEGEKKRLQCRRSCGACMETNTKFAEAPLMYGIGVCGMECDVNESSLWNKLEAYDKDIADIKADVSSFKDITR